MRRLYLLLAAALIVLSLVALTMGSAGAVTGKYMAIATAPSVLGGSSSYGHTKAEAKRKAMTTCKRHNANNPDFRNDCTGAVWVHNGWASVAYEKTKEHPYKNLAWGSGWGPTPRPRPIIRGGRSAVVTPRRGAPRSSTTIR